MSDRVMIIGGGITGLSAAFELDRGREEVMLLEAGAQLGGPITTYRADGFVVEGGPDSFLTIKPQAVELCRALGLQEQLIHTLAPRNVFVLSRGRLEPLPDGLAALVPTRLGPFLRSRLFSWPEKARFARELFIPPQSPNGTDESVGEFVSRRLGRAAVDRLAAPLLAGIYAGDVDRLSLRATFPDFAEMEAEHGSLSGAILSHRQRTRDGNRSDAVGLFATLRPGLDGLVTRLTGSLRHARVQMNRAAVAIERDGRGYRVRLQDGALVPADAVIVTTPAFVAGRLLASLNPTVAAALGTIPYASTVVVTFGFQRTAVAHPLGGHGYVVAKGEGMLHTACTWVSSKWPYRAPDGYVQLRCYAGRSSDQRVADMDDGDVARMILVELRPLLGIAGPPALMRMTRWVDAMPQYEVGHLARLEAIDVAVRKTPGIILAGAGYRGVGIPDCIRQGREAAGRAREHLHAAGRA